MAVIEENRIGQKLVRTTRPKKRENSTFSRSWFSLYANSDSFSSAQFSHSVVSDSLWPHELQKARPAYPSPTPRVHPNPCPLSRWCHPTMSSSVVPFSPLPSICPSIRVFSNESALCIRWPKYWSFSSTLVPPMNTQNWFHVGWTCCISLQSKGLKSLLQYHTSKASILRCSAFFIV